MGRKPLLVGAVVFFILAAIGLTVYLLSQQQDTRSRADCPVPASVSVVQVEYPACNDVDCDFTRATCSWTLSPDAVSYNITVTEVNSGALVLDNVSTTAATTKVFFPVVNQKTYKCDVVAVNSCGGESDAASHQLFCDNQAAVGTPTPTGVPTATPVTVQIAEPTSTPSPTPTRTPTPTRAPTPSPTRTPTPVPPTTALAPSATVAPTSTPLPTMVPTATPTIAPTSTPAPTATPMPTIAQTGAIEQTLAVFGVVVIIVAAGVFLFML